jgi:hypothetical protein
MSAEDTGLYLQNLREDMRHRFDRLEDKLDRKVDIERVVKLEEELKEIREATLTSDSVSTMIGMALQDAKTRGWTQKERLMAGFGFIFLTVNFILGILALGPDIFGSGGK